MKTKKIIASILAAAMLCAALSCCAKDTTADVSSQTQSTEQTASESVPAEPAAETSDYALPDGVVPVTWEPSSEHLIIESDEARELYTRIKNEDYPSVEELENSEVVSQIDALSEYYTAKYGKTSEINTPEREQLREDVLQEFLDIGSARTESVDEETGRHKYVYDGECAKGYELELVLGLPAAGKSTRVTDPDSEAMGAFILDCDVIKELLPEFKESHGCAADAVHMESMGIMNNAVKAFTEGDMKGINVILPLVSTDVNELLDTYIKPFEAAGYTVTAKFVPCEINASMSRVVMRELETGRIINSGVAFSFGTKPEEVYNELAQMTNPDGEPYVVEDYEADAA